MGSRCLRAGFCGLLLAGLVVAGQAAPLALSDESLDLAFEFLSNVQPLRVTFQVPANNDQGFSEFTTVNTATAILSDAESTYWITVPSALAYPGSLLEVPFTRLQLENADSLVEVVGVVDDHRGFFAILREDRPRQILPVQMGILLPPHHENRVGLMYVDNTDSAAQSVVSPVFYNVTQTFRLPGRAISGFSFEPIEIIGDAAIGAPVFHRTVDPLSGEPSFLMVGMMLSSHLENVPFSTGRAVNAPHSSLFADLLP